MAGSCGISTIAAIDEAALEDVVGGIVGGGQKKCSTPPALMSGFALHRLSAEQPSSAAPATPIEDETASDIQDNNSETSETSSSGSSAVGAYAMYALSKGEGSDDSTASLLEDDRGFSRALAHPSEGRRNHNDDEDDEYYPRRQDVTCLSGNLFVNRIFDQDRGTNKNSRRMVTPESFGTSNSSNTPSAPQGVRTHTKVRALSSECLEGLGWGEGARGLGSKRHFRGRSESEPSIPGAYLTQIGFTHAQQQKYNSSVQPFQQL